MAIANLLIKIGADISELQTGADNSVKLMQKAVGEMGAAATKIGSVMTGALTLPIVAVGAAAVKMGIDAVESENLVAVSFGNMKGAADDWARQMSQSFGLNRFEMEKSAGVLFNMTTGMGIGRDAAFEMSTGMVKLAADMASFRNIPIEDALLKLRSGLTGETEPLKAIGILVDDATIKTYAYANGIAKQGSELSQQQKVMARWGAILKQTANDQGDLGRTMESPANQLRIMKTRLEEAATALGVSLMPVITSVIGALAGMVPYIQRSVEWFSGLSTPVKTAAVVFLGLVAAAGPLLVIFGSIATGIASMLPLLAAMGGTVAGLTTALGLLGSAFAVVGVAMASWKIGTWIGETSGITDWVERTTGKLMGLSQSEIEGGMAARKYAESHKAAAVPVADLGDQVKRNTDAMIKEIAAQQEAALKTAASAAAQKAAAKEMKEHAKAVAAVLAAQVPLTVEQQAAAVANQKLGISNEVTAKTYRISADAVQTYLSSLAHGAEITEIWRKSNQELAEVTHKFLISWIDDTTIAGRKVADASAEALAEQAKTFAEFKEKNAQTALSGSQAQIRQIENERAESVRALTSRFDVQSGLYAAAQAEIDKYYQHQIDLASGTSSTIVERMRSQGVFTRDDLVKMADEARRDYNQMAQHSGEFSKEAIEHQRRIAEAAEHAAAGTKTAWEQSFNALSKVGEILSVIPGKLAAIATEAARTAGVIVDKLASGDVWGAVISGAAGAIKVLTGLFSHAGRDSVKDFAGSFGGFDELHAKLNTLGAEGEKFWIKLTQGTGRNNPEQAKATIAEITKAFDDQKKSVADSGKVAEEATQKLSAHLSKLTEIMSSSELEALNKGYASAQAEGFKGAESDFLAQQLKFYGTLQEGDSRLKTWFSGTTLNAFALIQSGQGDLYDSLSSRIKDLNSETQSLIQSIAGEAPEEVMGIVEQQARARIDQLNKDRVSVEEQLKLAAEAAIAGTSTAAATAGNATVDAINDALNRADFQMRVRVELDLPGGSGGGGTSPGYATGTRGQYVDYGAGTAVVLHGRERVMTEHEGLGVDGGSITVMVNAGELWDKRVVTVARRDAARGGTRTRASNGRSY